MRTKRGFEVSDTMLKPAVDEVYRVLGIIVRHANEPALNYCVNYARMGLNMTGHDLEVQIPYILNNMTRWRGPQANFVRHTLKAFAGVK